MTDTKPQDVPLHLSSNQKPASGTEHSPLPPISIPDGRRNSQGEILKSPTETWKPNMARTQSWNQEDLKRRFYAGELDPATSKALVGEEKGFTEAGADGVKPDKKHHHHWTLGKVGGHGSGANTAV